MKSPVIFLLATLASCLSLQAQDDDFFYEDSTNIEYPFFQSFDLMPGLNVAVGSDIQNVYALGINAVMGPSLNLVKQKLILKPLFTMTYFGNNFDGATRENLVEYGGGIALSYRQYFADPGQNSDLYVAPEISVLYSGVNDYLSARGQVFGENLKLLKGGGFNFQFGLNINYKMVYLNVRYIMFKPQVELDEALLAQFNDVSTLYEIYSIPDTKLALHQVGIGIGVRFTSSSSAW